MKFSRTVPLLALLLLVAATVASADTTISLSEAVRQGKVKVDVRSRGRAAGANVRVEVQRLVPEDLRIEVETGAVLLNAEASEQNMTVGQLIGEFTRENMYRPGTVMVLADSKPHSFLLEVYCLDYAKKAPRNGGTLQLAARDRRVARILSPPPDLKPSLGATQIAIWMDRAGISVEQARKRFRGEITSVDVEVANKLLVHAEQTGVATIPPHIAPEVRVEIARLFSPHPAVRTKAAEVLGELGASGLPAVPFLAENLLDRSSDKPLPPSVVRVDVEVAVDTAVKALEQLGLPELDPLVDALRKRVDSSGGESGTGGSGTKRSQDDGSQPPAVDAAGIVGRVFLDRTIGRLKHDNARVRERAAWLLGTTRNRLAVEPLIEALNDESTRVRESAAEALEAITNQSFGTDFAKWKEWWKNQRR